MGHIGHWADLTAPDFAALDLAQAVAILPIGAIEQHGPHLPLSVDRDLTMAVLTRAMPLVPPDLTVLALPVQAIGKSTEHQAWPVTLSLSADTLFRVLHDIAASIRRAGVPRLLILNGHGGNRALLDLACRDLRADLGLVTAHVAWDDLANAGAITGEDEARNGLHAGDVETSAMLSAHPAPVRMDRARDFGSTHLDWQASHPDLGLGSAPLRPGWLMGDLNPQGAVGNAAAATAAKGEPAPGECCPKSRRTGPTASRWNWSAFLRSTCSPTPPPPPGLPGRSRGIAGCWAPGFCTIPRGKRGSRRSEARLPRR
jgi:creatinine amidohydrolase